MSDQQPTRQPYQRPRIPRPLLPLFLLLAAGVTAGATLAALAHAFKWPLIYLILGIVIFLIFLIAYATLTILLIKYFDKQKKKGESIHREQT